MPTNNYTNWDNIRRKAAPHNKFPGYLFGSLSHISTSAEWLQGFSAEAHDNGFSVVIQNDYLYVITPEDAPARYNNIPTEEAIINEAKQLSINLVLSKAATLPNAHKEYTTMANAYGDTPRGHWYRRLANATAR